MSFRGRGAPRGGRGGFGGGFGGSRGGRGGYQSGPPDQVVEMGTFMHAVEGQIFCQSINPKIAYFNADIFLENKTPIGKVDEIMGQINSSYFSVKPAAGIVAGSFRSGDKFYIGTDKLLPLEKFLPKPAGPPGAKKPKRAGGASRGGPMRGGRGGRGSFGGGRGAPRGGARGGRGGFSSRGGSGGFGGGFSGGRGAPRGRGRGFSRG